MGRFTKAMTGSADKTNKELASEILSLSRLSEDQIGQLCPQKADKERLYQLINIVKASTDENEKILQFKNNIENLAGVALKLITKIL